jgi:opacity protein-like surface antigen
MRSRRCILLAVLVVACAAAPARAQVVGTLDLGTTAAGDVEAGRGSTGASVGYYLRGRLGLGLELDVEQHSHFFRDEDVAGVVPDPMVDLNTDAILLMGNIVAPLRIRGAEIWRPYAAAGLGVVHAIFDSRGADQYDTDQTNLAFNAGVGVMHALTRHVGLRADARYVHVLVDESARDGGYFKDYGFWHVSFGVTIGFPR